MFKSIASLALTVVLGIGASNSAMAQSMAQSKGYLRVLVVSTEDVPRYVHELDSGKRILQRLGVSVQTRVWRATFAGPEAGSIVVTQQFDSFAAFADAAKRTAADAEYSQWIMSLDKIRKIASDSLYQEL
ncbi:MAG: hypothetical protein ACLPX1_09630 [Steroidobacteraceae bacterium]